MNAAAAAYHGVLVVGLLFFNLLLSLLLHIGISVVGLCENLKKNELCVAKAATAILSCVFNRLQQQMALSSVLAHFNPSVSSQLLFQRPWRFVRIRYPYSAAATRCFTKMLLCAWKSACCGCGRRVQQLMKSHCSSHRPSSYHFPIRPAPCQSQVYLISVCNGLEKLWFSESVFVIAKNYYAFEARSVSDSRIPGAKQQ